MTYKTVLAATVGALLGGILLNASPSYAGPGYPTFDYSTWFSIGTLQEAMSKAFDAVETKITSAMTDLTNPASMGSLLTNGFTQMSNYSKAGVAASAQIADASNTSKAMFDRSMRNAQIRDEQTVTPMACQSVDGHQVVEAASLQGWKTAASIALLTDQRGEAGPTQPAYGGSSLAIEANNKLHRSRYCSDEEANVGLCSLGNTPNGDQRSSSLFDKDNLVDQDGINEANDYGNTLIQPGVPMPLRGAQLKSANGQDDALRRRAYNARMSLAHGTVAYVIGVQAPGVTLTASQKAEMVSQGMIPPQSSSWLQVVGLEVNRRLADINWATGLQGMTPAAVEREMATELAMGNYLQMQVYRAQLRTMTLLATQVAQHEEDALRPSTMMATPALANN